MDLDSPAPSMTTTALPPVEEVQPQTLAEILRALPPARREGVVRNCMEELLVLLESVHNSVGFPKGDGRWSPVLAHDLEAVRQKALNPGATYIPVLEKRLTA